MALFNKQKQDKPKKPESIIGKIIYGFLLFMPILSIAVRSGYVIFNKNAYESYSSETIYKEFNISDLSQYNNELVYTLTYKQPITETTTLLPLTWFSLTATELGIGQADYDTITKWNFATNQRLQFRDANNNTIANLQWTDEVSFNYIGTINATFLQTAYITRTILTQDKLDNVFEYGISQTEKSNLYNWSKTTGTYTVLTNVCENIGITNTFTPMLMAYWLIISVIYFLFDIALILIWLVHDKIHALKDAI